MTHTPVLKEGAVPPTWDLGDFTLRPLRLGDEVARTGFAREGTLRQFRIARNTPCDFYVYALLRQDFAK